MNWIWEVMKRMINKEKKRKGMINEIWTDNNIGDEGARMISEGLKCNSTLTTLYLGGDEKNDKEERKETE